MQAKLSHRAILLASAIGLVPIGLSYGVDPKASAPYLFGFSADVVNASHILRAIMGLYFGMIVLWLIGFFNPRFTVPALLALAAFMLGLASGRLLSFVLDGQPVPLLTGYFILEIFAGSVALWSYRQIEATRS